MSDIALRAVGLGKMYRIGAEREAYRTLRDTLAKAAKRPIERLRHPGAATHASEQLWALRDIDLEVQHGEALGVIGSNGAGKSTLLKVVSRITEPTEGRVEVKGRVASLLEVGSGFHNELTGRENIQLNGAILGMTRAEIKRKFDDIVEFSEIGHFLDTPVKRYSSGMYVRLAFAVAAHLDPEIMIVDEVLAVGDASFQKKCLGKMNEVAHGGRTVLFVSHNMTAIQNLCSRCVWIDEGSIRQSGGAQEVVYSYLGRSAEGPVSGEVDLAHWPHRYGSGEARIVHARLLDEDGVMTTTVQRTRPMEVRFAFESRCAHPLHFTAQIFADTGEKLLHLSHHDTPGLRPGVLKGRYEVAFAVPVLPLCEGQYKFWLAIHTESMVPVDVVMDILPFVAEDIADSPRPYRTTASDSAFCWTPSRCSISPAP